MKLDFKRIMSSVLAFVMLFSSLVMVNVVSVSAAIADMQTVSKAAESSLGGTIKEKEAELDDKWYSNGGTLTGYSSANIEISLTAGTSGRKNNGSMFNDSTKAYANGTKNPEITIKVKTPGKVYIDYAGGGGNRYATINDGVEDNNTGTTGANDKGIQTSFTAEAKTYTLKKGDADIYVYAIGFVSSSGTTYTITGNCTGLTAGKTFTLTDNSAPEKPVVYTATVNEGDATYTVTKKAEKAPFGAGTKLTASLAGYKINSKDSDEVTLSGSGETFNAAPDLQFENNQYSVTIKVVSNSDSSEISNANAYKKSDKATPIAINKDGTEIKLNKGTTETFYVGAANFLGAATKEISEADNGTVITVKLDSMPASGSIKNGNYFSTELFYPEAPEEGAANAYNLKDLSNYTANGFTFSKFTVQMFDSNELSAARLNIAKKQTIKYTPAEDGILTIIGASGSGSDKTRGYDISPAPEDGNASVLFDGDKPSDWVTNTHQLKEGTAYTITVKDVNAINIQKISFEPSNTYDVTINADNKTEDSVTINVGSQQFTAEPSTKTTSQGLKLTEGKHTLSAKGYTITPNVIDVQSSGVNSFDVTIEKSTAVTVKFSLADSTGVDGVNADDASENIKIEQLDATNAVVKTENLKTMSKPVEFTDIDAGTSFRFSSSARNVVRWLTVRNGVVDSEQSDQNYSYKWKDDIGFFNGDSRYFIYTVPSKDIITSTGTGEYGIQFTAVKSVENMNIERNENSNGKHRKDLEFGQYGFGADKAALCGNDARQNMDYIFEYAGLGDYGKGYAADIYNKILTEFNGTEAKIKTTNEYGILNAEGTGRHTHAVFSVGEDVKTKDGKAVQAIIDRTGAVDLYELEIDPEEASGYKVKSGPLSEINNGIDNKEAFLVEAGKIYGIRARNTGADVECYIKSVRILNPNNILDSEDYAKSNANVTKLDEGAISALEAAGVELGEEPDDTVFRIVGTINLDPATDGASITAATNFLQTIQSVGFDAYKESDYKTYDDADKLLNAYHFTGKDSLDVANQTEFDNASVEWSEIEFDDIANSAVDFDNNPKNGVDLGTLNPDGSFSAVYVQTFFAAKENMVLIPWVKYVGSDDKVYSLIELSSSADNGKIEDTNNVYLKVN